MFFNKKISPYFSQVETAADIRSRELGYILICRIPCDTIDAAVSACLWRTFNPLILLNYDKKLYPCQKFIFFYNPGDVAYFCYLRKCS